MGVRERINQHWSFALGAAILLVSIVAVVTFLNFGAGSVNRSRPTPGKVWFSDDDGKTWFADDEHRIPPFDHNGKQAYRAYVYTCDGGKTNFVACLARYSSEGKARLERARAFGEPPEPGMSASGGVEMKKPGDTQWVKASDPRSAVVQQPICPNGKGEPTAVFP